MDKLGTFLKRIKPTLVNRWVKLVLAVILGIIVSFMFFSPNLQAKMGIIDDHTYVASGVVADPSLVIKDLVNAPEFRSFGNFDRFRVFWSLAGNLETWAFGVNASAFYLVNILVFGLFVGVLFFLIEDSLGFWWALPFTLWVVAQNYFAFIFTRLGTAEVWTMFGLTLFSLGAYSLYSMTKKKPAKHSSFWAPNALVVLGGLIMVGSKENFAVTFLLVILLLLTLRAKSSLKASTIVSAATVIAFNFYQIAHIMVTQSKKGVDFYMNDTSASHRISKIIISAFNGKALPYSLVFVGFFLVLTLNYVYMTSLKKEKATGRNALKLFWNPLAFYIVLGCIFAFNFYIYNGVFYDAYRYSFPSILSVQLTVLLAFIWAREWARYYKMVVPSPYLIAIYFVTISVLVVTFYNVAKFSRNLSRVNVVATNGFYNKITSVVEAADANPKYPIVLNSFVPDDYEPLISVGQYLRFYGVQNRIMIKTNYTQDEVGQSGLTKWETAQNNRYQKNGGDGFSAYRETTPGCFFVDFSGAGNSSGCSNLGLIWRIGSYPY